MKKILFVGGGTLGHIFPAIPVIKKLKEKHKDLYIFFIGTKNGLEKNVIEKCQEIDETYYQDSLGFKRSLSFSNFKVLYKLFRNYYKSRKLLKKIKPDLVIGMGGYVSGAVLKAALKLKIKTFIHEQNSVFGLTNNMLKKKVDRILLSFPIDNFESKKAVIVGNPRISEYYEKHKNRIQNYSNKSILVVGGSRGAKYINDLIIDLKDKFIECNIKVTIITGSKYYKENYLKIVNTTNDDFRIIEFVPDISKYLLESKIVVSRSGATTLSELSALNKVSILIPSPNVTNNHQEKNALIYANHNAAVMIVEKELNKNILFKKIKQLLDDENLFKQIKTNLETLCMKDSAVRFMSELEVGVNL